MIKKLKCKGVRKDNGNVCAGYYFKHLDTEYLLWGTTNGHPNMIEIEPKSAEIYEVEVCNGITT
jgi:hypothetical protein